MKILQFPSISTKRTEPKRHIPICTHCCNTEEDVGPLQLVVEAGWLHLCEHCAHVFEGRFSAGEDLYDRWKEGDFD